MKRVLTFLSAIALAVAALAQTPQEILSRMEAEMDKHANDGIIMTIDVKIPVLGTMTTRTYSLGDRLRIDGTMMGVKLITWTDGTSTWTYNAKTNEVEIDKSKQGSSESGDAELFSDITDGYDVSIKKETADAWHILCKKTKSNPDKDAPNTMELVVRKGTYDPVSLTAKLSGLTMTMRDIAFGVTEKQVTFDPKDYPDAKIVDKR